jgi:hypothetical protein
VSGHCVARDQVWDLCFFSVQSDRLRADRFELEVIACVNSASRSSFVLRKNNATAL